MLNLFVASINISSFNGAETFFCTGREAEPENIKYKFHFAPKVPSICINQKCSMGVESFAHSLVIESKREFGGGISNGLRFGKFTSKIIHF